MRRKITQAQAARAVARLHVNLRNEKLLLRQVAEGATVELEHTKNVTRATKIAIDHLRERTDYYKLLKRMEASPRIGRLRSKLRCNTPVKSTRPGKKRMVLVCEGGKQKIIHYGDTNYRHNYSAKAKRSFRARHKCNTAERGSKLTARYWACRDLWPRK